VKLHQGVIYQQEREEHTIFTYTRFKLYCSLTFSQLFLGIAVLHMVFIFALHMQDALFSTS